MPDKTTVYILEVASDEDVAIGGVFSTLERAMEQVPDANWVAFPGDYGWHDAADAMWGAEIHPYVVDEAQ